MRLCTYTLVCEQGECTLHIQRYLSPLILTHYFNVSPKSFVSSSLLPFCVRVSADPLVLLSLSLWVPSRVRFDLFHLLPNPYFNFFRCPVITSLTVFLFFPPPLSLLWLVSLLCVCVCSSLWSISQGRKLAWSCVICVYMRVWEVGPHTSYSQTQLKNVLQKFYIHITYQHMVRYGTQRKLLCMEREYKLCVTSYVRCDWSCICVYNLWV